MGLFCFTMKDRGALDKQELSSLPAPTPRCLPVPISRWSMNQDHFRGQCPYNSIPIQWKTCMFLCEIAACSHEDTSCSLSFCFLPLWMFLPVLQCLQLTTSETATRLFTLFKTPDEAPRQDFLIYSRALFLSHHTRPTDEHDAHIWTAFVSIWSTAPGGPEKERLRNTVFPLCEGFQPFYFKAAGSIAHSSSTYIDPDLVLV